MEDMSQELLEKLSDKKWRISSGKIYKIKNKDGLIVPFLPNKHQMRFIDAKLRYRKIIIPKARQLGISTVEDIWDFDDVLFSRNFTAGIIATTTPIARMIFNDKIKVLWENLPPRLKYVNGVSGKTNWVVNNDNVNEMSFENTGSRISVST